MNHCVKYVIITECAAALPSYPNLRLKAKEITESEPKTVELGRLSCDDSEIMWTQLVIWHGTDESSLRLLPLFFAKIKVSDSKFDQSYESEDSEYTFIPRYEIEVEETTINW